MNKCTSEGIYITIIGIGYESNAALADILGKFRGCNYFLAQTEEELDKYLVHDFNYICFPSAFDYKLEYNSNSLQLTKCIGTGFNIPREEIIKNDWLTNNHKKSTGAFKNTINFILLYFKRIKKRLPIPIISTLCNFLRYEKKTFCEVNTTFPSHLVKNQHNELYIEGGMILLRMSKNTTLLDYECNITMKCISHRKDKIEDHHLVTFPQFKGNQTFFSNENIRNGLSLYYYAKLCRSIMKSENGETKKQDKDKYKKEMRIIAKEYKEKVISFMQMNFNEKVTIKKKHEYISRLESLVISMRDNNHSRHNQVQEEDDIKFDENGRPYMMYRGNKAYLD